MKQSDPVAAFLERFTLSLDGGTFAKLTLSGSAPGGARPEKILGRLIELRGAPHLSLTLRHATNDVTRNMPLAEAAGWLRTQLSAEFRSALLGTTERDWQLFFPDNGTPRLVGHKPAASAAPPRAHDQPRNDILNASANDWLHGLGVTDANGKVRAAMSDKHRQINRYLETLTHLATDAGWLGAQATRPPGAELAVADMGCGKGYLTFGAWHLFNRQLGLRTRVLGVETREDLVATTNTLAKKIGADTLSFVCGDIETASLPKVDALIALHACNTATDAAIRRGIECSASLIVVAPCCHKELRPQLQHPALLAPVLRHGVMEERLAEWLTDGLRALFLEWAGYRTKLFEFISTEHTPKNLMLAAVREREPFTNTAAREQLLELKKHFGIQKHALDPLLVAVNVRRL